MSAPSSSRWDFETRLLAWLAICVSVFSFLYYFRRGEVVLYGDAVAHINIARRVFDSKTPGLLQLGTVWLPLPHLLMMPFLVSNRMWQSGVGGSIPSMIAYVFGVVGMFRLVRGALPARGARIAAWAAALAYGANPNLIYLHATAMGETLYLTLFIWTVVYFSEFVHGDAKALTQCGICVVAACLTRYDGWFLAAVLMATVIGVHFRRGNQGAAKAPAASLPDSAQSRRARQSPHVAMVNFVLIAAAAPALWLAYNAAVYRNPLEFATGPYSARAIEQKTKTVNPAKGNLYAASMYFLKSAELNVAEPAWLGRFWLLLAAVAITTVVVANPDYHKKPEDRAPGNHVSNARMGWPLLLLGIPMPFYALSVAYGGVPIFVPSWWPFSQYNLRYGLQLLPAFAAVVAILFSVVLRVLAGKLRTAAGFALATIVIVSYISIWRAGPICYREASINARGRVALEAQLAQWLKALPPDSTLLMYLGEHPGAVQQAGLPLKRVIQEGNHRVWKQPADPEGLWERALANPAEFADYVVAFEGDSVWQAVPGRGLKELVEIKVTGQSRAILYRAR
jgi:hypothetical protein